MSRRHAFAQLILVRVREFFREPEVIFWVYGFPLILATVLGIAFASSEPAPPTVDVAGAPGDVRAEAMVQRLKDAKLHAALFTPEESRKRLAKGKTDLVITALPSGRRYSYDSARDKSVLARHWVDAILSRDELGSKAEGVQDDIVKEPGSRYIDFLLPGLIGMNVMGGGLFGVGFVLVDMRVRKLFKRLMATPMHRGDFLLALITARLVFLLPEMLTLLLVGNLAFGVPLQGSLFTLLLVILAGALAFAGIGLLLGCRTEKTETISGLINLAMLPMYLLSGVFFPSERFPDVVQPLIRALPLTQLNESLRAVMLEGAGIAQIWTQLAVLLGWALSTFALGLRWFRWK